VDGLRFNGFIPAWQPRTTSGQCEDDD
jgi:hypothetical protein